MDNQGRMSMLGKTVLASDLLRAISFFVVLLLKKVNWLYS